MKADNSPEQPSTPETETNLVTSNQILEGILKASQLTPEHLEKSFSDR